MQPISCIILYWEYLKNCDSAELQYNSFQVLLAWDFCPQAYENYVKEVRSGSDAYLNSTILRTCSSEYSCNR